VWQKGSEHRQVRFAGDFEYGRGIGAVCASDFQMVMVCAGGGLVLWGVGEATQTDGTTRRLRLVRAAYFTVDLGE